MDITNIIIFGFAVLFSVWLNIANIGNINKSNDSFKNYFVFILIISALMIFGLFLGYRLSTIKADFNKFMAIVVFLVFAVRIFLNTFKEKERLNANYSNTKSVSLVAIAEGITVFGISVGAGLICDNFNKTSILSLIILLLGSIVALFLGRKMQEQIIKMRFNPISGLLLVVIVTRVIISFF